MNDMTSGAPDYPGDEATVDEILDYAEAYFAASRTLFERARNGKPQVRAPARLCAIHATELYLNAFLRARGESSKNIRARMHNLADEHFISELRLRRKTGLHLQELSHRREYLIARYAPDHARQHTPINRLTSTLEEVRAKLSKHLGRDLPEDTS